MKTKLTAQKALKLFHLWEDLIISGELPDPKRFNQDFLKFYGGGVKSEKVSYTLMFNAFVGALDLMEPAATYRNINLLLDEEEATK